ncbi:MAG TPA: peptide chain release factor 1 [bacterium]|nr:peptide chain release factor 1 [bacterium]
MRDKVEEVIERFKKVSHKLTQQEVINNPKKIKKYSQEHSKLEPIVEKGKKYIELDEQIKEDKEVLKGSDEELKELVKGELDDLISEKEDLEGEIKYMLIPKDPSDKNNAMVEIRAGTGGDEASLFAADLFRMYSRYVETKNWEIEEMSSNAIGLGGYKEIIFLVKGKGAYGTLKFESGVHRVQRVPETETSGRIHTSASTVAVLPEAKEVDVKIDRNDLKIDTFRASGPGGQHVNKADTAIRIVHQPTGLTVSCQDQKSQHKNKEQAMKILRSRLLAKKKEEQQEKMDAKRKKMVGSGDRSAKIRTYNFPQGRVTDHRIELTLYKLDQIMEGALDQIIEPMRIAHNEELLENTGLK